MIGSTAVSSKRPARPPSLGSLTGDQRRLLVWVIAIGVRFFSQRIRGFTLRSGT
jgi:hypothetical protein